MPSEIVQHGHCHVCGRVVKYGEPTCSETCKNELEKTRRGRKRTMLLMYAVMGVFLIIFVVLPMLSGRGA